MRLAGLGLSALLVASLFAYALSPALAQAPGAPPPSVGVIKAEQTAITETSEFVGRIQAADRVSLTARVTAFLDQRLFTEGSEVAAGDLLYRLERPPFENSAQQAEAALADAQARLENANIRLARARELLNTPAGQRAAYDDAQATQRSQAAQVLSAQAQLRQAQINLAYTEIRAPTAGKISRSAISVGNVVSPTSGALATIVSQDPMYVVFPVASRALTELVKRYTGHGGMTAVVVRLKLPDGSLYGPTGTLDYVDPSVSTNTDTILLRARIANPPNKMPAANAVIERPLTDGAFVTVVVEGIQPVMALGIPRGSVLSDQQGSYVYVVGAENKVEIRRIQLGQSTASVAIVAGGLKEGDTVIVEGIQRVRPGVTVNPGPAAAPVSTSR